MAGAALGEIHVSLFVAAAALGEVQVSLSVTGAALGEVQVSLFAAGAALGEVQASLFVVGAALGEVQVTCVLASTAFGEVQVAGAAHGDFLNESWGVKRRNLQYKMVVVSSNSNLGCEAGCGLTVSCSDHSRIVSAL